MPNSSSSPDILNQSIERKMEAAKMCCAQHHRGDDIDDDEHRKLLKISSPQHNPSIATAHQTHRSRFDRKWAPQSWPLVMAAVLLLLSTVHTFEGIAMRAGKPASAYAYSRLTPFSPHYRPECDLILPPSARNQKLTADDAAAADFLEPLDVPAKAFDYGKLLGGGGEHHHHHHHPPHHHHHHDEGDDHPPHYHHHHQVEHDNYEMNDITSFYAQHSHHHNVAGATNEPFTNSLSFSKRSSYIPGGHVCITYDDINRALSEAKMQLGLASMPFEIRELSSELPKAQHIASVADVLLKTSALLAQRLQLSREAILYALPRIDTYKTAIKDICPTFLKPVNCELSKYRTLSGMCNNLDYPSWGSSRSAMLRFLPPDYADGLNEPRVARSGRALPPPRVVSFMFHQDVSDYDNEITYLVIAFGQMLDHDLTFAARFKDKNDKSIQCCKDVPEARHPSCYVISLPKDDPFYKFFNRRCMDFTRIMPGVKPNCPLGPRHQTNLVSSYIDASFVYGNTQSRMKRLRSFHGGKLKATSSYRSIGYKDLLPMKTTNPDLGCQRDGQRSNMYCFDSGDDRSNEQLQLAVMHTLWLRQHNTIADELSRLNPHWNDEKLFQEARRIVGAMVQHITYNEYLPIVVGRKTMNKYGISLLKTGYFEGYNAKVNPGIRVEFQGSAYRFGHSILPDTTDRYNKFHDKLESIRLSSMLQKPFDLYRPGIVDTFIMGLVNQPAYRVDSQITTEVTNHLFEKPGEHFGLDLAAINVARARELGIPGYNELLEYCGLPRVKYFEELIGTMDNRTIHRYMQLYEHPDDIDFWSAGIAEYPLPGAMVGPSFACIISEQFSHIRSGDRFWYENAGWPSQFTEAQLTELRKVKLARLLCDNADDMDTVQLYPLLAAHQTTNPRVACHDLPAMDLSAWQEAPSYFGPRDEEDAYSKKKAAKA